MDPQVPFAALRLLTLRERAQREPRAAAILPFSNPPIH